jgi:hypothetical protein
MAEVLFFTPEVADPPIVFLDGFSAQLAIPFVSHRAE